MQRPQLIVFTDLDGTLLDHHSYSYDAAEPALEQLRQRQVPLILTTSKTSAEVAPLQQLLQLNTPAIVENGALITGKEQRAAHIFGSDYPELITQVHRLRRDKGYRFRGFHDFSPAEIAQRTGLCSAAAERAAQRQASEPLCWEDSEEALNSFREDLTRLGLQLQRGGRFYHVLSAQADKGRAVCWVLEEYYQDEEPFSIGLGDGPNDQPLLEAVDLAVVIPSCTGLAPMPQGVAVRQAKEFGPVGWNQALLEILREFDLQGDGHG